MKIKYSKGENIFNVFNIFIMLLVMIVTLYPILHVTFASISDPDQLMTHTGPIFMPLGKWNFEAYNMVFKNPMIGTGYRNTLFYVIAGTILNMIVTCLSAYVLSRKGIFWKGFLNFFAIFTMFFSGGLIPLFLQVKSLGLIDSPWAMILPHLMSTTNLIVMRTSFAAVPESLEESARLDGAKDFTILFRIIIPLCMPIIAVMILFYAVYYWNSWFFGMLFLRDRDLYPLQLVLRDVLIASNTDDMMTGVGAVKKAQTGEAIKYATIIVSTLPILTVYPFLQRYFVSGMMVGAVKG